MAIKVFSCIFAIIVALLVLDTARCDESFVRPDVLFIQNPDTAPVILSPEAALLSPARNNLVCTAAMCRSVCNALGFRFGRCNVNRVCVCSNL